MSWPLALAAISLSFPHKICFENFSTHIYCGDRIAVVGRNGSGKSSLLNLVASLGHDLKAAHIPQTITEFSHLSGGERFDRALSRAIGRKPDLLILDEPTNHLDQRRRQNLRRLLASYQGALLVATHDREFLMNFDILWIIKDGRVDVFRGSYTDYERETDVARRSLGRQAAQLKREKAELHQKLMKEQERAAKSRAAGEKSAARGKRNWSDIEIRKHLADFLFRKQEEVEAPISCLSGGEQARLSLAIIAARPPKLLLLDEISNNIDQETRCQIVAILSAYPAAMLVISHDDDFLAAISAERIDIEPYRAF